MDMKFELGDFVLVDADHILEDWEKKRPTRKLGPKKIGPFKIIKVVSDTAYKLELPSNIKVHPVFHLSKLEKYYENPTEFQTREFPRPPPIVIDNDHTPEFEVEEILDNRTRYRKQQYLVKWKGYPLRESTWEPESHLSNATDLLKEYKKKIGESKKGAD